MPSISTAPTRSCGAASPARFGRRVASILAIGLLAPTLALATMVRVQTPLGPVDMQLYDSAAPNTVQNFLGYVNRGAYDGSFFHRSVPGFVVQGGGYTWKTDAGPLKIPAGPPVVNEFSAMRSNLRGTVAMAKLGGDPNSATTEWFVNLADNAGNLDTQNGGFTVFGKVTTSGLAVMDRIAALQIVNFSGCTPYGSAFSAVPVLSNSANCAATTPQTLTLAPTVRVLPGITSDIDRTLNYLESVYPEYAGPVGTALAFDLPSGIRYRYYAGTNSYVGEKDGFLYYLVPALSNQITLLGRLSDYLAQATAAGY